MLMPRRVKHRKVQRGRMSGPANRKYLVMLGKDKTVLNLTQPSLPDKILLDPVAIFIICQSQINYHFINRV